jgi:hypothetical protein
MTIRKLESWLRPADAITVVLTKPQIADTVATIVIKREVIVEYELSAAQKIGFSDINLI